MNDTAQAPLQGAEWQDCTVTVAGPEVSTYPGKKLGETGLGYWIAGPEDENDTEPTFYAPTHILSGYRLSLAGPFYSEEHCQQFIKELASLTDWNCPREELNAKLVPLSQQYLEIYRKHIFEDAGATAGGGAW